MIKKCKCCDSTILNSKGLVDLNSKRLFCSKECYNEFRSNQKIIRQKLSDPEFFNEMIQSIKNEMVILGVELDENGDFIKSKNDNGYNI